MARIPASVKVPELTAEMYARGLRKAAADPFDVVKVSYSRSRDRLNFTLRKGVAVSLPRANIHELATASPAQLAKVEIQPGGDGITFRALNVDISIPGLLVSELGTIFARNLGRKSKGQTSPAKSAAARRNGSKGGRPRRVA